MSWSRSACIEVRRKLTNFIRRFFSSFLRKRGSEAATVALDPRFRGGDGSQWLTLTDLCGVGGGMVGEQRVERVGIVGTAQFIAHGPVPQEP